MMDEFKRCVEGRIVKKDYDCQVLLERKAGRAKRLHDQQKRQFDQQKSKMLFSFEMGKYLQGEKGKAEGELLLAMAKEAVLDRIGGQRTSKAERQKQEQAR